MFHEFPKFLVDHGWNNSNGKDQNDEIILNDQIEDKKKDVDCMFPRYVDLDILVDFMFCLPFLVVFKKFFQNLYGIFIQSVELTFNHNQLI